MLVIHAPTDVATYAGWGTKGENVCAAQCPYTRIGLNYLAFRRAYEQVARTFCIGRRHVRVGLDCKPNYGNTSCTDLVIGQEIGYPHQDRMYIILYGKRNRKSDLHGGATNICLVKPDGMINMEAAGLRCLIARDLNQASP